MTKYVLLYMLWVCDFHTHSLPVRMRLWVPRGYRFQPCPNPLYFFYKQISLFEGDHPHCYRCGWHDEKLALTGTYVKCPECFGWAWADPPEVTLFLKTHGGEKR